MKKYRSFLSINFQFLEVNFSIYLNRRVFVMSTRAPASSDAFLYVAHIWICCTKDSNVLYFNTYNAMGKLSRRQIDVIFLNFGRK